MSRTLHYSTLLPLVIDAEDVAWRWAQVNPSLVESFHETDPDGLNETLGSYILRHGKAVKKIHGHFSNLESQKCRLVLTGLQTTHSNIRVVHGLDDIDDEGVKYRDNHGLRIVKELSDKDFEVYSQALLCAQYPKLYAPDPPATTPDIDSPLTPPIASVTFSLQHHPRVIPAASGATASLTGEAEDAATSMIPEETLCEVLLRAFGLSKERAADYEVRIYKPFKRKSPSKILVEELSNQLLLIDTNKHPYYNPKKFTTSYGYETWRQWACTHIGMLMDKVWRFSKPHPKKALSDGAQRYHINYKNLLLKLIRYDMSSKYNQGDQSSSIISQPLSTASIRLLKEFALRYGVGDLYRRVIYLEYLAEHFENEVWFIEHINSTLVGILDNELPDHRDKLIITYEERNMLHNTALVILEQCKNSLKHMKKLFPRRPADGISSLIELVENVLQLISYLQNKRRLPLRELLTSCAQENFKVSYERHKMIAVSDLRMDPYTEHLSPKLMNRLVSELEDEVTEYRDKYQSVFQNYIDITKLAAQDLYQLLMQDVLQMCDGCLQQHNDSELNLPMVSFAYRLNRLDQDWAEYIPPSLQVWRGAFLQEATHWLHVLQGHCHTFIKLAVSADKFKGVTVPGHCATTESARQTPTSPVDSHFLLQSTNSAFEAVTPQKQLYYQPPKTTTDNGTSPMGLPDSHQSPVRAPPRVNEDGDSSSSSEIADITSPNVTSLNDKYFKPFMEAFLGSEGADTETDQFATNYSAMLDKSDLESRYVPFTPEGLPKSASSPDLGLLEQHVQDLLQRKDVHKNVLRSNSLETSMEGLLSPVSHEFGGHDESDSVDKTPEDTTQEADNTTENLPSGGSAVHQASLSNSSEHNPVAEEDDQNDVPSNSVLVEPSLEDCAITKDACDNMETDEDPHLQDMLSAGEYSLSSDDDQHSIRSSNSDVSVHEGSGDYNNNSHMTDECLLHIPRTDALCLGNTGSGDGCESCSSYLGHITNKPAWDISIQTSYDLPSSSRLERIKEEVVIDGQLHDPESDEDVDPEKQHISPTHDGDDLAASLDLQLSEVSQKLAAFMEISKPDDAESDEDRDNLQSCDVPSISPSNDNVESADTDMHDVDTRECDVQALVTKFQELVDSHENSLGSNSPTEAQVQVDSQENAMTRSPPESQVQVDSQENAMTRSPPESQVQVDSQENAMTRSPPESQVQVDSQENAMTRSPPESQVQVDSQENAMTRSPPESQVQVDSQENAMTRSPPESQVQVDSQENAMTRSPPESQVQVDSQENAMTRSPPESQVQVGSQENAMARSPPESQVQVDSQENAMARSPPESQLHLCDSEENIAKCSPTESQVELTDNPENVITKKFATQSEKGLEDDQEHVTTESESSVNSPVIASTNESHHQCDSYPVIEDVKSSIEEDPDDLHEGHLEVSQQQEERVAAAGAGGPEHEIYDIMSSTDSGVALSPHHESLDVGQMVMEEQVREVQVRAGMLNETESTDVIREGEDEQKESSDPTGGGVVSSDTIVDDSSDTETSEEEDTEHAFKHVGKQLPERKISAPSPQNEGKVLRRSSQTGRNSRNSNIHLYEGFIYSSEDEKDIDECENHSSDSDECLSPRQLRECPYPPLEVMAVSWRSSSGHLTKQISSDSTMKNDNSLDCSNSPKFLTSEEHFQRKLNSVTPVARESSPESVYHQEPQDVSERAQSQRKTSAGILYQNYRHKYYMTRSSPESQDTTQGHNVRDGDPPIRESPAPTSSQSSSYNLRTSGSLVDVTCLLQRVLHFAKVICQILYPFSKPVLKEELSNFLETIGNEDNIKVKDIPDLSEHRNEERKVMRDYVLARQQLYEKLLQVISNIICLYGNNLMCMDLCGMKEPDSRRLVTKQVVKDLQWDYKQGHIWGCRHMAEGRKDCPAIEKKGAKYLVNCFEPISEEICVRVNDLIGLMELIPSVQQDTDSFMEVLKLKVLSNILKINAQPKDTKEFVVIEIFSTTSGTDSEAIHTGASLSKRSEQFQRSGLSSKFNTVPKSWFQDEMDIVFGHATFHIQTLRRGLVNVLTFRVNQFCREALSVLLSLELSTVSVEARLSPLVEFLHSHFTAMRGWLYSGAYIETLESLWSAMINNIEKEVDALGNQSEGIVRKAVALLQAIAYLIRVFHQEGKGISFEKLTDIVEDVSFWLQLYTQSEMQLISLFERLYQWHQHNNTDSFPRTWAPPPECQQQMMRDLHGERKCFSGVHLVRWLFQHAQFFTSTSDLYNDDSDYELDETMVLDWAQKLLNYGVICNVEERITIEQRHQRRISSVLSPNPPPDSFLSSSLTEMLPDTQKKSTRQSRSKKVLRTIPAYEKGNNSEQGQISHDTLDKLRNRSDTKYSTISSGGGSDMQEQRPRNWSAISGKGYEAEGSESDDDNESIDWLEGRTSSTGAIYGSAGTEFLEHSQAMEDYFADILQYRDGAIDMSTSAGSYAVLNSGKHKSRRRGIVCPDTDATLPEGIPRKPSRVSHTERQASLSTQTTASDNMFLASKRRFYRLTSLQTDEDTSSADLYKAVQVYIDKGVTHTKVLSIMLARRHDDPKIMDFLEELYNRDQELIPEFIPSQSFFNCLNFACSRS